MAKKEDPVTMGIRWLQGRNIPFRGHQYEYQDHGGATLAAEELGVPLTAMIKTLVFETDDKRPLLVLMHGDREVSAKALARCLEVKGVSPCPPARAEKLTGYQVGGISPFGTRTALPVYVEKTILDIPVIFINGGKRGFIVEIESRFLKEALQAREVAVAIPG